MKKMKYAFFRDFKLKKIFRAEKSWLFNKPKKVIIEKNNPPILIYQMGKVGSTSIKITLEKRALPNPIYHVHQLTYEGLNWSIKDSKKRLIENKKKHELDDNTRIYTDLFLKYVVRQNKGHKLLRRKIDKNLNNIQWKIITLVRDPIMREISNFFFTYHQHPELVDKDGELLKEASLKVLKNEIIDKFNAPKNWVLTWFDEELKKVFGIDVYLYPFDHDNGYILIHHKNIHILIIKLEALDRCFERAISGLIGKKIEKLTNTNIAKEKFYYQIYRYALDNLSFDYDFCTKIYESKYATHFYSAEERKKFIQKWSKKTSLP